MRKFGPAQFPCEPGYKWVTVYNSVIGWKVAIMWWNPEGFPEPYTVLRHMGPYDDEQDATEDAGFYANVNDLPYQLTAYVQPP